MYKAKQLGGKGFCFYDDELDRQAAIRRRLHAGLKFALDNHEFCLHYQPIFRPQSSSISGIEALLRWYDPKRGITLPGTFISVLEETNLILNVGAWVLNEACAQFQQWLREGRIQSTCWISVNVSPKQFIDNQIVEAVKNTILETQIRPENLHLEITEGILNDNSERTMDCLTELTRIGVHLSVDDFGTGFSSMQYLKSLPVQSLKIDQNFVQNYLQNPDDNSITRAIVQLAHSLGKEVVAEGVEDPQLETAMTEIGCDYLQGYYSSKPLPADAFISNFHYH
jgi:EAL domain-containing protein (putative c-di-GMP-specific phosphodiesterase class I)